MEVQPRKRAIGALNGLPVVADRALTFAEKLGMPQQEFNREWADVRVAIAQIKASSDYQNGELQEIRNAQAKRAEVHDAQQRRLEALEANAWTWAKFFSAWPKIAAGSVIVGSIIGLILWLVKHLHL